MNRARLKNLRLVELWAMRREIVEEWELVLETCRAMQRN
jgi:hypothetical protein